MLKAIPAPREEVSEYAPKMISLKIPVEKIREVIGSGGKTIQKICADTGAKVDIDDDGSVFISAVISAFILPGSSSPASSTFPVFMAEVRGTGFISSERFPSTGVSGCTMS